MLVDDSFREVINDREQSVTDTRVARLYVCCDQTCHTFVHLLQSGRSIPNVEADCPGASC